MRLERPFSTVGVVLLVAAFYGCGAGDAKPPADGDAAEDAAPAQDASADAAPAAAPADPGQQPLTVGDIDRWERGMAAELEAVHAAAAKRAAARTADDTVAAMMALQDQATLETGARAAGLDGDRYNLVRGTLSAAASYLAPSVGGIDTTGLSPAQRADMRRDNAAQLDQMKDVLPPDVVSALTPRAAQLRTKDLELTAARLKGAGMGTP